jgi:hypothetical protein
VDASGEVILDFSYNDTWYPPTDGTGRTLVVRDAAPSHSGYGQPTHWAISGSPNGSPGGADGDFASSFAGWRWDHFTQEEVRLPDGSENLLLVAADANPDNDALNNLGEYAFGRDPRKGDAEPVVRTGSVTIGQNTYATVTFRRRHKALDLDYDVQFSGNLGAWSSTTEQTGNVIDAGGGMEEVTFRDTVPAGNARRFARVSVIGF